MAEVLAACDGEITGIQNGKDGSGNTMGIVTLYNKEHNITCRYLHCKADSDKIKVGSMVKKGQSILEQGKTGTDHVHLHFEIHPGNIGLTETITKLDPITYIPELLIWLDQTPRQHGPSPGPKTMQLSYDAKKLFSQRYINDGKQDNLQKAFLLLKERGREGEIPTVTKRVLCENGLGDDAFCASTVVQTVQTTTTPQTSSPPSKKAKYPTTAIKTTETPNKPYKIGGYPTSPYPDSLAASAPVNSNPDRYVDFWLGVIWGVIAQEAGSNPKVGGSGKKFVDVTALDGGTVGLAHFAKGGIKAIYEEMDRSTKGGIKAIFGGNQTNRYSNDASSLPNLISALSKNTTPSGNDDNGTGPSTDDWWWNGMINWLGSRNSAIPQMRALIKSRVKSINLAIKEGGWKTDRQLAIAAGLSNSLGPGGFQWAAAFHDWDEEAMLEGFKRKLWYMHQYRSVLEDKPGLKTKDDGHKTRRATEINIWFPIEKQTDILVGGELPKITEAEIQKVANLLPPAAFKNDKIKKR